MADRDPFAEVPGFLAAFSHIIVAGFFGELQFRVSSYNGQVSSCNLNATGFVPNDEKYAAPGCTAIIDPRDIVQKLRELALTRELTEFFVKVETKNWNLWDEAGDKALGGKGAESTFSLSASFKTSR